MITLFRIPLIAAALATSSWGTATAQDGATHPLDGLNADELAAAVATLKADGRVGESGRFPLIEILEPDKSAVLAWQEGEPVPRRVRAVVKNGPVSSVAVVDLRDGTIESFEPAAGESMVLFEEFVGAMEIALAHPDLIEGLDKRGVKPDEVWCLPLTAGNFGTPEEQGRRLMKIPCYLLPDGSNFYAKPIEGLFALVDLNTGEALDVVDTGTVPIPNDPWGYTEEELEKRYGLRQRTSPATLSQPGGSNVSIDGTAISWDIWRFRLRTDKRPGVVVSNVDVQDGESWRPVLYQAHLSEVFVPYMDPDEGWYWRTYMDSGEYGFGLFLSPLRAGVDCPEYADFLPALLHTDSGEPLEIPNALCIFERSIGDPAWRHFEVFAQSDEQFVPTEGRPVSALVVRSASEVGNYDYLIDYVFHQDGRIRIMVGSTGLDAVKGAASTSMADATAADDSRYGSLVAPNLVAPNHDHFFNFRLDMDVDGQDNNFVRVGLVAGESAPDARRRTFWVTRPEMPTTELAARYRVSPETPAMYKVVNANVESHLGHQPGYMINADNSVAYSPLDVLNDPPAQRNAYIEYTYWVTPYDPKATLCRRRVRLSERRLGHTRGMGESRPLDR